MNKPFNIHDWQAKQRLAENDEYQKRQDRLTPGKNPDEFYGKDSVFTKLKDDPNFVRKLNDKNTKKGVSEERSSESMNNADIRALQIVVSDYSLNKVLNTIAVIADKTGKHDEANMIQNLASQIQDFDKEEITEHHDDKDFPGKKLSAWDLLDKIKDSNEDLYNKVEAFMKSMNEMNTTGTGTSISTGNSPAYATPFAFKKKKKK